MRVHPADYYIGLHADQWIGRADSSIGFGQTYVDLWRMTAGLAIALR